MIKRDKYNSELARKGRNDCVVRAISTATGTHYDTVAEALCRESSYPQHVVGEPVTRGFSPYVYERAMRNLDIDFYEVRPQSKSDTAVINTYEDRYTVIGWLRSPQGRDFAAAGTVLLLSASQHLFAACHGRLSDYTGGRCRLNRVYVLRGLRPVKLEGRMTAQRELQGRRPRRPVATDLELRAWIVEFREAGGIDRRDAEREFRNSGGRCSWKRFYNAWQIVSKRDDRKT